MPRRRRRRGGGARSSKPSSPSAPAASTRRSAGTWPTCWGWPATRRVKRKSRSSSGKARTGPIPFASSPPASTSPGPCGRPTGKHAARSFAACSRRCATPTRRWGRARRAPRWRPPTGAPSGGQARSRALPAWPRPSCWLSPPSPCSVTARPWPWRSSSPITTTTAR
jgi:hypothetical protein